MNILFLEDNIGGISSLAVSLRHMNVTYTVTSDLNAWKAALNKFSSTGTTLDLLIIDDNIYKETTLEKLECPNIGTNGGSETGSQIVRLLRSDSPPGILSEYKDIPIIIYTVHNPDHVKRIIGDCDDVYVFEKLRSNEHEEAVLQKCKELLGLV